MRGQLEGRARDAVRQAEEAQAAAAAAQRSLQVRPPARHFGQKEVENQELLPGLERRSAPPLTACAVVMARYSSYGAQQRGAGLPAK